MSSTLKPQEVISLLGLPLDLARDPQAVTLAYATLYDRRGGTVEIEIKESKQGIGINRRSKQRFAARSRSSCSSRSLAHNLIVWSRRWLTAEAPRLAGYGALRMVRDLFQVAGLLGFDPQGQLTHITLNRAAPLAAELATALPPAVRDDQGRDQGRRHLAGLMSVSQPDQGRSGNDEPTESVLLVGEVCHAERD